MSPLLHAAAAFAVMVGSASPSFATACHDAKGKFIECPTSAAAKAQPKRCKNSKGKFAKCGSLGAKPA